MLTGLSRLWVTVISNELAITKHTQDEMRKAGLNPDKYVREKSARRDLNHAYRMASAITISEQIAPQIPEPSNPSSRKATYERLKALAKSQKKDRERDQKQDIERDPYDSK